MNMRSNKKTACFLIGVTGKSWTTTGESFIGSVSDDPYDIRTYLKSINGKDNLDHIGTELISTTEHTLTERGYFARPGETTRGLNSAGLGFTCAMVIENERFKKQKNLPVYADITDYMMKNCHSVDQAIELFKSNGATYPAYSVLLTDATGDLAHLEVGSFGISVLHRFSSKEPGCVMAVNCYQTPEFIRYNDPVTQLENTNNNNAARYNRGKMLADFHKGKFDLGMLIEVLSDHSNRNRNPIENPVLPGWGYSICNHGTRRKADYPSEDLPWGTVSSEIIQPSARTFWYTYGWPCGSKPEYGDQIFQERSWGRYLPFDVRLVSKNSEEVQRLTTNDGLLTSDGVKYLAIS